MKLHRAWVLQAASDANAAQVLRRAGADPCQLVAKCQQAVEKAVTGLVEAMNVLGLLTMPVDSSHHVARYASAMVRAAEVAPREHRDLKRQLVRLFPAHVRKSIAALDKLVPEYPKKGALAAKNTEYPFQPSSTEWLAPSMDGVFARGDVKRYQAAAERVAGGAMKVMSALERVFPREML
jgi:hypothetical protein